MELGVPACGRAACAASLILVDVPMLIPYLSDIRDILGWPFVPGPTFCLTILDLFLQQGCQLADKLLRCEDIDHDILIDGTRATSAAAPAGRSMLMVKCESCGWADGQANGQPIDKLTEGPTNLIF